MTLSAVSAFVIPPRFIQPNTPAVEALFAPVARPAGAIARWAHDKFAPEVNSDPRDANSVKQENQELRDEVSSLTVQLAEVKAAEGERIKIGAIRRLCTAYAVVGADSGARESLAIAGSRLGGLRDGMFALYPGGVAGHVARSGLAGVRVRLITDEGCREVASFGRFSSGHMIRLGTDPTVVEGVGKGRMRVLGLTKDAVRAAGLQPGDWAFIDDKAFPENLQGRHLGQIVSIGDRSGAPLYAQIILEPPQNLTRLKEVLVVTKETSKDE